MGRREFRWNRRSCLCATVPSIHQNAWCDVVGNKVTRTAAARLRMKGNVRKAGRSLLKNTGKYLFISYTKHLSLVLLRETMNIVTCFEFARDTCFEFPIVQQVVRCAPSFVVHVGQLYSGTDRYEIQQVVPTSNLRLRQESRQRCTLPPGSSMVDWREKEEMSWTAANTFGSNFVLRVLKEGLACVCLCVFLLAA